MFLYYDGDMREFLHHLFLPRSSNNHRPKVLHHSSLILLVTFLVISAVVVSSVKTDYAGVLGATTDITAQDLLAITNKDRMTNGLQPLTLNSELSQAALMKAKYMFDKNFWAHNAPDGTTPWVFIKNAGYNYVYAGENLARGFTSSSDVVDAWMASPTHRQNMLSPNYQEIGFAIMDGKLLGENTTLVVEMFGNTTNTVQTSGISDQPAQITPQVQQGTPNSSGIVIGSVVKQPFFDSKVIASNIAVLILGLFILVLIVDMIVIQRKNVARVVGHNLDHILFFVTILILILLFGRGITL